MKEQETQGDKQENKADNNLSDAVFNFTPADSGIEMMDANMPEMAENPKQEETPESIITVSYTHLDVYKRQPMHQICV